MAVSLDGDNCCYGGTGWLSAANAAARNLGLKTVLWGCSVEGSALKDPALATDLNSYDLIAARESLTYKMLIGAGIDKNTKLYPDPAFALKPRKTTLPSEFLAGNTVGINVSPLIMGYSVKARGIASDLFDGYGSGAVHVVPVQTLRSPKDLTAAFELLLAEEKDIRRHLTDIIPGYIRRAYAAADEIRTLTGA